MEITRPTIMEINTNNFKYNISEIKKKLAPNVEVMPVIKANGYGTHLNMRLDLINDFNIVAVANVDEAVFLRELGFKKEIFVLNQPYKDELNKIVEYDISIGLSSDEFLEELNKLNKKVTVHLELETGMGRTGIRIDHLEEFITKINSNINIEGAYTHLSSPDNDPEYTKEQVDTFTKGINIIEGLNIDLKYKHVNASNGILYSKESDFNLVRPGIIMYGYPSSDDTFDHIDLKPVAKLKSKITFLKNVKEGTSISYGRTYITTKETKVATIPIGYADGFRRELSNKGYVFINGYKANIIGRVCMDSFMADVSEIPDVKVGDEVIIWDNINITLEELAKECNTINYEILSTVSERVPRVFIDKEE